MGLADYIAKHAAEAEEPAAEPRVPAMQSWFTPYPHQKAAVDKLLSNDGKLILAHEMGTGKASCNSAKVYTTSGPKRMGDIRPGDLVINPAGGHAEVLAIFPQGKVDVYRVVFSDGTSTRTTKDHLWQVNSPLRKWRGAKAKVVTLGEIMEKPLAHANGNFQNFIPMTKPAEFLPQAVELDPYLLGLLLGDGGMTGRAVNFTSADAELLAAVTALLPAPVRLAHDANYDYRLTVEDGVPGGNPLTSSIRRLGLLGHGSATKFIPPEYLYNDVPARIALLQGLLDTDGGPAGARGVEYTSVSKHLAEGVQELVWSLGGLAVVAETHKTYPHKGEKRTGRLTYRLYITLPAEIQPFRLKRKADKYTPGTKYKPTRAIVAVLPDGQEEATCIAVDSPEHLYLTDSYIVTHNTATALYGFEKMRHLGRANKALVVVPAGLRDNFATSGVGKFTSSSYQVVGPGGVPASKIDPNKTYTVVSYDALRRNPVGLMKATGADTLIMDEFHSTRNEQAGVFKAAVAARSMANNFIGLTASLINNSPKEIATLLTISEGNRGMSPQEFGRRFTQTVGFQQGFSGGAKPVIAPKNESGIAKITAPRVDYVQTTALPGNSMPEKKITNVEVPMSSDQYRLYQLSLKKLGPLQEWITRRDKNVTVKDANLLFAQIAEARRLSNSVAAGRSNVDLQRSAQVTPKAKRVLDDTEKHLSQDPSNRVVLYSNLIHGGVDVLVAGLKKRGIEPAVFVGAGTEIDGSKVTNTVRQEGVNEFKAGKRQVIVLSGAGAEGLDLKDATAFYALDGHFNPERILQAEARARRLGGQSFRAPEERVVDTRRYMSTVPESERPGFFGKLVGKTTPQTTDEWMYGVAGRKWSASKQFYDVIKQPHKYLRKYVDKAGKVRYEYKKEPEVTQPSFFRRIFGGAKPAPVPTAGPSKGPES